MDVQAKNEKIAVVSPQHFEHTLWMNELKFFEDEVNIFEHQLEKLVKREIKQMMPALEQFQNNFIRQKEVLDELKHDIKVHEQQIAWSLQNNQEARHSMVEKHEVIREKITTFKKLFAEVKTNFFQFLKEWQH